MRKFFATHDSWSQLILRVTLGVVMFPHGAQKLLGWFGGYGFSGTMNMFTEKMGIPSALAFLVIMTEFFGSLGLILGFLRRLVAFGVFCFFVVGIGMVYWLDGFLIQLLGES